MEVTKEEFEKFATNSHYETDFEFATRLNRRLLKPVGCWPLNLKYSKVYKRTSKFLKILCSFLLLFLTVPEAIDTLKTKDLKTKLVKVGPLSFHLTHTLCYFFFLTHQKELGVCLETMRDDWRIINNQKYRDIMINSVQIARNFTILCSSFQFAGIVSFVIVFPLIDNFSSTGNDTTLNLAFATDFLIFDPHVRPNYDIVYSLQIMSTFSAGFVASGICCLTILFVMHLSGQLQIIRGFLHLLVENASNEKPDAVDNMISFIVQRHLRSLRFAEQLENLMNEICMVEFLSSTSGICLIGHYIILEYKDKDITKLIIYILLFISYTFNVFIYCYFSEVLITECEEVGRTAYMIQWYCLPGKKARDLIPIIMISCKPAKLTAGKMVTFSISCFCSVLKGSAAYLNMLRSFYN